MNSAGWPHIFGFQPVILPKNLSNVLASAWRCGSSTVSINVTGETEVTVVLLAEFPMAIFRTMDWGVVRDPGISSDDTRSALMIVEFKPLYQ